MYAEIDDNQQFKAQTNENTGVPVPMGVFYKPRWVNNEWVESLSEVEQTRLKVLSAKAVTKQIVIGLTEELTVKVDDLLFSATEKSQVRMLLAINAAKTSGLTETGWILKDDDLPTLITLAQLEQAQSLAIQALGAIIVGNTGNG